MGRWNDTDEPLGYLITFRTYGGMVAGDERGSIDRAHNKYRRPRAESNVIREQNQVAKLPRSNTSSTDRAMNFQNLIERKFCPSSFRPLTQAVLTA